MRYIITLLGLMLTINMGEAQNSTVTTGPENGSLVIAGGGGLSDEIMQKFIDLAGGNESRIVVIPTASGSNIITEDSGGASRLRKMGVKDVQVLHTYDKEEADKESFASVLKGAGGVWFSGGRQWRLVDSYKGTLTEKLIWDVLNRGGVVGGSSAGATIQGSYLARGDTKNNQIMMGDHEEGLSFVKNIAIDQHVIARNRHFDMFNILENRPELLGISIDEGTAVVVQGNEFEVLGPRYVIIFDGTFWSREGIELKQLPPSNELFYFLREGDRYNMKERKVIDTRR